MTPAANDDYFTRAAAEKIRHDAECAKIAAENDERRWVWLGDRDAAVIEAPLRTSIWEMGVTIIGKTEAAVAAKRAEYMKRHPNHVDLTQFYDIKPWHKGFRVTGTRWVGR